MPYESEISRSNPTCFLFLVDHSTSMVDPFTVINLTGGESNDGDPRKAAEALKSLATSDGSTVLLTAHVSSSQFAQQIFLPAYDQSTRPANLR